MTDQPRLPYESPYPSGLPGFHNEPRDTEVTAAEHAFERAGRDTRRVVELLTEAGKRGMCDHEGRAVFYSFPQRRCDLTQRGLVVDSGQRRPSPRGRPAIVWVLRA